MSHYLKIKSRQRAAAEKSYKKTGLEQLNGRRNSEGPGLWVLAVLLFTINKVWRRGETNGVAGWCLCIPTGSGF